MMDHLPTREDYDRLLKDYRKVYEGYNKLAKNARALDISLQISQNRNSTLESKLKAAGFKMVGADGVNPDYPDLATCVKDQMNNNGKSRMEAEDYCTKLADKTNSNNNNNTTKQASIKKKKELPSWAQNYVDLFHGVDSTKDIERLKQATTINDDSKEVPAWVANNPSFNIDNGTRLPNNRIVRFQ